MKMKSKNHIAFLFSPRKMGNRILLLILVLGLWTCIKPYTPKLKTSSTEKYVIQGMVSNQEGWQEVNVSITSSVNEPRYIPIDFCEVKIIDDQNNIFDLINIGNGTYKAWMTSDELVIGRGYKIKVIMEDGIILESDYDYIPKGPAIGDVYYEVEQHHIDYPEGWLMGVQFYTNMIGENSDSRYYRWKLTETYEYHSVYPLEFYYNGEVQQVNPPDSSEMVCYKTDIVDQIFTLSTASFNSNSINRFPLHYIENTRPNLGILYSLLIEQMAVSRAAYFYWDQLRQNNEEQGGLYSTQPLAVKGNIRNVSLPEHEVLGFFQACYMSTKRIFVEPKPEFELNYSDRCYPEPLRFGFIEISPRDYPAYLLSVDGFPSTTILNDECIFCTQRGGVTQKPDFWPN